MEDRRIDGVPDDHRRTELDPELRMLAEAVVGLQHGGVRDLGVHRRDPGVGSVVEPPVRADRPVDAVHHPAVVAREPAQAREVEVEGVEETCRRAPGDPAVLDPEPAALELANERAEELMAAACRRGLEVVEEREVGVVATRSPPVDLVANAADGRSSGLPGRPRERAGIHDATR